MSSPPRRSTPVEREIKVPTGDLAAVRDRLVALGAVLEQRRALERNWVLDGPAPSAGGRSLLDAGRLLRLRDDVRGARLTYKGPASFEGESGSIKVREERETALADVGEMLAILQALGYRVTRRYEKRREAWRWRDAVIALDETPIGAFVEVEGGDPEALARELGLDPTAAVRASYSELWERHRRAAPGAGADMLFGEEAPTPEREG